METIDDHINSLKDLISTLPYFSKTYGRAWKFREKQSNNKVKISPYIIGAGKNIELIRPNDREKGIIFFYVRDKVKISEYSPISPNSLDYSVDIIIWLNTARQTDWIGLEAAIAEINALIRQFPDYVPATIAYEAENIFEGFTIDEAEKQYFSHPYTGFRMGGILNFYENDCSI